jgi:hypothetical protein
MKFASSFSALLVVLPLIANVSGRAVPEGVVARAQRGGQQQAAAAKAAQAAAASKAAAAAAAAKGKGAAATTAAAAAATGNAAAAAPAAAAAQAEDPTALQSSLTISPSVIQNTDNGQNPPVTGQSAADTSPNNFANLCATTLPQIPLTNGLQITTGSCNPIPIGYIPAADKIPSSKYQFPPNFGTIPAQQTFNVVLKTVNMQIGVFTNAQKTYFGNPQKLNAQGQIIGHTHVVIESIPAVDSTAITNAQNFVFFKGVNDPNDANDEVTVPVANGLKAGAYRMCTILSSQTHQPVITAVAQHGSVDDCIYFTAADGGAAASNATAAAGTGAAAAAGAGAAAAGKAGAAAAANTGAAAATTGTAAAATGKGAAATGKGAAAANGSAAAKGGKAAGGKAGGKRSGKARQL